MKVAKNMDSVFANCTSDELDFDLMFDEDDSLIDAVCGVNEAGIPWTGPDPETEYQVDGDASYSEKDAEGSKDVDLPISGEAGKDGPYKGNSAESRAHDVTPGIKKAIGEDYYDNQIKYLLSFDESDEVDKNEPDPSNDGDLDQDEVKEDYTMYNENYTNNFIDSLNGYDEVNEAVDTLLAGAVAIDEAFENSTEAIEEKVLNKVLSEAEKGTGKVAKAWNFAKNHKTELGISAGLGAAAMGSGILAVKGIKGTLAKKKAKKESRNEAFEFEIEGRSIPCDTSSYFENADVCLTGFLKESYDDFIRNSDRINNMYSIALEADDSYMSTFSDGKPILHTSDLAKSKKVEDAKEGVKKAVEKSGIKDKILNNKAVKWAAANKGKAIAGTAIATAGAVGAGMAIKKHRDNKAAGSEGQNESAVYYSAYQTYYDEAADEITLIVTPPVAKLEGAKLGLAGEVIPVEETYSYEDEYNSFMESLSSDYDEILDEDYIFVTEKFNLKENATKLREAIKAMASAAAKFATEQDKAVRISAIIAAGAAVFGGGALVGKVMTKRKYEKQKAENESVDYELDELIESVLSEGKDAKKSNFDPDLRAIAYSIDFAIRNKAKNMSKNEKIACGIAAGLGAAGIATPVVVKKIRQKRGTTTSALKNDPDNINYESYCGYDEEIDDILEGINNPF